MKTGTQAKVTTFADGHGIWHARLDFEIPQGNTEAALSESAMRARARRAITKELQARAGWGEYISNLKLYVHANRELPSGGLIMIEYAERSDG